MKLYRIQDLIDQNNEGKIVITKIKDNENNTLIETKTKKEKKLISRIKYQSSDYNKLIFQEFDPEEVDLISSAYQVQQDLGLDKPYLYKDEKTNDILVYEDRPYELVGELKYDLFTIIYNYLGKTDRIYDTNYIGNIEYEDLSFNLEGRKEVKISPEPPIYKNNNLYSKESPYRLKVLKDSERIDDVIHEGLLEDGRLFYDTYLGDVYRTKKSEFDGAYKRNSGYDRYLGKGYVTIEDGILDMNIYIPKSGFYEVRSSAGNHFNNGTLTKVFLDNVGYYFRTPTDRSFIWNKSILESFRDSESAFYEEAPKFLEKGIHNFKFEFDPKFSTKDNDFDILILKETSEPEAKNPFYIKTNHDFKFKNRKIIPMRDFYVDNDSFNMGTGQTLETVRIDGEYTNIDEVNRLSDKFTLLTGSLKNDIKLDRAGLYNMGILFRRKNNDPNIDKKQEEMLISINGNQFKGKVYEYHNDLGIIGLFNTHGILNINEYVNSTFLEKENEIIVTVPDNNNFIFDSLIINSNTTQKKSNVNPKANLYPNIDDYYFIFDSYYKVNNYNELDLIDSYNARSFNKVSEYKNEGFEFYLEKPPIHYALNHYDYQSRKLEYEVIFHNLLQNNIKLKLPIQSYFLPKILMVHDEMKFDRYMIFRPYVFESIKYESVLNKQTYEERIKRYSRYNAKLIPIQNYHDEFIDDIIIDFGEDWKNVLMDKTENLDDITFTHIYTRIKK